MKGWHHAAASAGSLFTEASQARGRRKWLPLLFSLVVAWASPVIAEPERQDQADDRRESTVLFVHSYHPGLEWNRILADGFLSTLAQTRVRIESEYLDAKRRPGLKHAETFLRLLREKYSSLQPDVLAISDDPAFELLWQRRDELFPGVPIVFMGLNGVRDELLRGAPGVTGIFEAHTTEKTVDLALDLTGADGIVVISDTSETGKANEVTLNRMTAAHPDVRWIIERDLSVDDLPRLAALPAEWPVITMLPMREGGPGQPMLSQRRSANLLRKTLPNPLFYDSEWMIGSGIVGGHCLSGKDHGAQAGELVLQILGGAAPETLPLRFETRHRWIFDQREIDRFGWSRDRLPATAEFWFAEPTFWERHRELIAPVFAALALAGLVIAMLSFTVRRQRRAEARLREQEQRLSAALAAADAGVFEVRQNTQYASPRWLELVHAESAEAGDGSAWTSNATTESQAVFHDALGGLTEGTNRERIEMTINGTPPRILDVLMTIEHSKDGRDWRVVGIATDITAKRKLEEEASRRHRLEVLGELSAGIAHDFNNILAVVIGNAALVKKINDLNKIHRLVREIEEAGDRAADLVKQLLAFGRQDARPEQAIDLNERMRDTLPFLERLLGAECGLSMGLCEEPLGIKLARTQLDQVLCNLAVNARDAMPQGGEIRATTRLERSSSGNHAVLEFRDSGVGMDEATRARVFEPFYTTKPVGEGTGLGLSTVHGIVTDTGGTISVESGVGAGTAFELRWPLSAIAETVEWRKAPSPQASRGRSILLVEDDPYVGRMAYELLSSAGYDVTLAKDGIEGFATFSERPDAFELVVSDIVLPGMDGIDLIRKIRSKKPGARVCFMSAYTGPPSVGNEFLPAGVSLLRKPFKEQELLDFIERQLGRASGYSLEGSQAARSLPG